MEFVAKAKQLLAKIALHWGITAIISQVLAIVVFPIIEALLSANHESVQLIIWIIVIFLHIIIGIYAFSTTIKLNELLSITDLGKIEDSIDKLK